MRSKLVLESLAMPLSLFTLSTESIPQITIVPWCENLPSRVVSLHLSTCNAEHNEL